MTTIRHEETTFIPIRGAKALLGLGYKTLRNYAEEGRIQAYKTPYGQWMFSKISCQELAGISTSPSLQSKENFIYCRVSSKKQNDDLQRQISDLSNKYPSYNVISDIASGINFKRKGLKTLLESCMQRNIGKVVVAHRDRLCRFGFELIEQVVQLGGGQIIVDDNADDHKSSEQELAEDLLSIVHIYSCRQMGKRRYAAIKNNEGEALPDT